MISIRIKHPSGEPIDVDGIGKFMIVAVPVEKPRENTQTIIHGLTPQETINMGNYMVKVGQAASQGKRLDDIRLEQHRPPKQQGRKIIEPPSDMRGLQ